MRIAIWLVFGLLTLLWTAGALLASEMAQWVAQALASGEAVALARDAAQWPLPEWMAWWVDPALARAVQSLLLWSVETLGHFQPLLGSAAGWLVPLVWLLWGLGLVLMLLFAVMAHLLLGRALPKRQRVRA